MKFFKWAYDKTGNTTYLLNEYAVNEKITQAEALARIYNEMIEMGVY